MKISVKAKTGSKKDEVIKIDEKNFIVKVKKRPIDGKANEAIVGLLAKYFDISRSKVIIISGLNNSNKIIEILLK